MSKKSFNDIEQVIKDSMESHEPAFKEASWKKMEALLDKDEDRKRPVIFWLWLLIPLLVVTGGAGYFIYNKNINQPEKPAIEKRNDEGAGDTRSVTSSATINKDKTVTGYTDVNDKTAPGNNSNEGKAVSFTGADVKDREPSTTVNDRNNSVAVGKNTVVPVVKKAIGPETVNSKAGNKQEILAQKNKLTDKTNGKLKASITAASAEADEDAVVAEVTPAKPVADPSTGKQQEDVVVVKIETNSKNEKEIEKIIDSVIEKTVNDKKEKTKISRFFIIVAAGAEASGTKLFSADKITARAGLAAGYNINKNLSVQAGFFISNKKYKADGSSYKTKPGSYWDIVDIKEIDANCRVYEIPVQVNYNFTPGKKLNVFASVGLSSYIMKKEDYSFHYTRYGQYHQAEVYYSGNKSLFSVLRISGGVEKKVGKQFSVFASPGISIPLAGVGEGEIKLYSTELMIGLKFTPSRKNK